MLGAASLGFVLYLGLGMTKTTDLRLLAGFPPPGFYSIFETETDCPLGLECFKDFDSGLAHAKKVNKPILLDFTGWACVNCRKMEENVWSDPAIYGLLKEEYVLISLYVDDREALPENEQFNFQYPSGRVKRISTIARNGVLFKKLISMRYRNPITCCCPPTLTFCNRRSRPPMCRPMANGCHKGLKDIRTRFPCRRHTATSLIKNRADTVFI